MGEPKVGRIEKEDDDDEEGGTERKSGTNKNNLPGPKQANFAWGGILGLGYPGPNLLWAGPARQQSTEFTISSIIN
jgi:hypothetical protein